MHVSVILKWKNVDKPKAVRQQSGLCRRRRSHWLVPGQLSLPALRGR